MIVLMIMLYYRPVRAMWSCKELERLMCQAQHYRVSSRQVRRLNAIHPGPVNAHYAETLTGAPIIRAFGAQGLHVRREFRVQRHGIRSLCDRDVASHQYAAV